MEADKLQRKVPFQEARSVCKGHLRGKGRANLQQEGAAFQLLDVLRVMAWLQPRLELNYVGRDWSLIGWGGKWVLVPGGFRFSFSICQGQVSPAGIFVVVPTNPVSEDFCL